MASKFEKLVKVRSQLAVSVRDFLTQMADKLDQTDWWRSGERIRVSAIAIEQFVLTTRKRERPSRPGPDREERGTDAERHSPMDELDAERYELPVRVEEREEERWHQVIHHGRLLGLKGAPGSGKTFTTRQTVVSMAGESAALLNDQQRGVDEIDIPVWVTAKNLAQTGAREIEGALLEAMENGLELKIDPRLREWLKREIVSARAFIVVDALDEMLSSDIEPFKKRAGQLESLGARVIATCRTMQWEERKGWLGWSRMTEIELAPLKRKQQRELAEKFFANDTDFAQGMEHLLQVNYSLRHACTTPLLLTFACLLHEKGEVNESISYAGLYAKMGRMMFCGSWRSVKPSWTSTGVREESCWRFFEGVAWRLFAKAPQLNRFTLDDWLRAARQREGAPMEATAFLEELEQVGFIAPAGYDEQCDDRCWSFAHRTFLEFLAARALSRMGEKVWLAEAKKYFWFEPEWIEALTFLAGLVDDATPLIEAVEKEQREDDLFGSMLSLKARLAGAAWKLDEQVVRSLCDEVFSFWQETRDVWHGCLHEFAIPMLTRLAMNEKAGTILVEYTTSLIEEDPRVLEVLSCIGNKEAVDNLVEMLRHEDIFISFTASKMLPYLISIQAIEIDGILELLANDDFFLQMEIVLMLPICIDSKQAAEKLLRFIKDREEDSILPALIVGQMLLMPRLALVFGELILNRINKWMFWAVAEVLDELSNGRAVERFLELVRNEQALSTLSHVQPIGRLFLLSGTNEYDELIGIMALAQVIGEQAIEGLLEASRDKNEQIRQKAAIALGQIDNGKAVDGLLKLMRDKSGDVRQTAAEMLGLQGNWQAVEGLLGLTWDENVQVRQTAVISLGQLGDRTAVERLLELTWDEKREMREKAVAALGSIGDRRVLDRLLGLIRDEHEDVRRAVAIALGEIGDRQAVDGLLELTHDEDKSICQAAAISLGKIGDRRAVGRLLELTWQTDDLICGYAVDALGRISDRQAVDRLIQLTAVADQSLLRQTVNALWRISRENKVKVLPK
jgi:HEAT repeat protein